MRFRPPAQEPPQEASWALLRAFGPRRAPAPRPPDPKAAFQVAQKLGLEARIGRCCAAAELAAELDEAAAMSFVMAGVSAERNNARLSELYVKVRATLQARGIGLLPLKLAALQCLGVRPLRTGLDVDILVEASQVEAAMAALLAAGLRQAAPSAVDHHAAPLADHSLGLVEVHRELPGVAGRRRRSFARWADLEGLGHCERAADGGWQPSVPLVAAHALSHALVQHGFAPQGYHLLRFVSDLSDLGQPLERREVFLGVVELTRGFLQESEVAAAAELSRSLTEGRLPHGDSRAGLLLQHCVLGALSPSYGRGLSRRSVLFPALPGPRPIAIARAAWELAFPKRSTMERLERRRLTGAGLVFSRLGRLARLGLGRS